MPSGGRPIDLSDKTLLLIFTFRSSLETWDDAGIIEREVALYNRLADEFDEIYLCTYGDNDDRYVDYLAEDIHVCSRRWTGINLFYSLLMPLVHYQTFAGADVVKTNQMNGSWTAVIAKYLHGLTLIVRTGFILSMFADMGDASWRHRFWCSVVEWFAYTAADGIISPSMSGYRYVERRYHPSGHHHYIPNYIETNIFAPQDGGEPKCSVCTVCRLSAQKNLLSLFQAIESTGYSLTVIGTGPKRGELEAYVRNHDVDVEFRGNVSNHDLPEILTDHEVFVLPSLYEGMPKSILEAMSCGLAVIGTDVEGTREVIQHGENGLVVDTTPDSIRTALTELLEDDEMRNRLGENARRTIETNYSLDVYLERELALYRKSIPSREDAHRDHAS